MKNLFFYFSICYLFPFSAFAQETPEQVLQKILAEIKAASNTSPVVEYVDWQKAFSKMPEDRKKMINVETPEGMKSYYKEVLKDPVAVMKKQFESRLGSLPPAQKPIYEQNFARMQKALEDKTKEMFSRIAETEYQVGTAEIQGDSAVVALTQNYKGEVRNEKIHFEKTGNAWLLPAVSSMSGERPAEQKPAPAVQ